MLSRQLFSQLVRGQRRVVPLANSFPRNTAGVQLQAANRHVHTDSGSLKRPHRSSEVHTVPRIRAAYQSQCSEHNHKMVVVEISDGSRYEYPLVWLRDNCQCESCYHAGSNSRILDWEHFDVEHLQLKSCAESDHGNKIKLVWSDGHKSQFGIDWLVERNFSEENRQDYLKEWYRPQARLWGKQDFRDILREFQFADVINSDEALKEWIEALSRYGLALIRNAPLTENECRKLADRVGFIRKTHYGEEFIVQAKEGTSNVAYLSTPLQMHSDLPYYDYKPGCNLLHCLVQSQSAGGQNLIADAFYVAELMRHELPEDFAILAGTLVNWTDLGQDEGGQFHSIYRAPVICVGRDGNLERINHSVPQRDSFFNIPVEKVEPWYRAMSTFVRLIHREAVEFKTAPGDILTFSNIRMVHGRTGYSDTESNTRHIVGAYLDWDEIYSKLRVLKRKLSQE
ncbi:gamma-butyrobetaine dioxygenase-like isoform X2 [Uranotaenia lowii]|uniref:gamma-butyrobetaine dioxygenase-like isoform X2 n=1 Tax=Uranotaenia lowii TaxID=190385 RepID=UPI00247A8531|nr:gamma-butyrobetaine dioxygenase-like isoform X2 [Uranotaenia lowii]